MPRIDPLQLLKCLSVLLTPDGGILSMEEVPRLVNLMTKFSKKLVSKCVYVLILTNTDTSLLELFMAEGGWTLIQTWLEDAMKTQNDDLVVEILKLLLITPVDIERLKSNTIPRLVKTLTKRDNTGSVKELATMLVQKWLAIVKSTTQEMAAQQAKAADDYHHSNSTDLKADINLKEESGESEDKEGDDNKDAIDASSFYKLTVRGGRQVISRLASTDNEEVDETKVKSESKEEVITSDGQSEKENEKKSEKDRNRLSRSSSSSKSSSKSSSSSRDKDKDRHKSGSKSSKSDKDKSSSNKDKDRRDKDKDKHKLNGAIKHSSRDKERKDKDKKDSHRDKEKTISKESKEKQAEKDKDTLAKIKPQTLDKLGRIPKKSSSDDKPKDSNKSKETEKPKEEPKKKGTMSIEVRKNPEDRPKTVKIFNSKMRSAGLEEEVKRPPPRNVKKPQPTTILPSIPQKRPSPPREPLIPEKKVKLELADRPIPERPGAIKLIPPKPKPIILQESDIFMDALTAATAKKEPKKRKRRASVSKDSNSSPPSSPTKDQQVPGAVSPPSIKNIAPPNFYQDTLETSENAENKEAKEDKTSSGDSDESKENERSATPTDTNIDSNEAAPEEPKKQKLDGGLKGVLVYVKKTGPKKSIKWKADEDLVEIRHFELDETERVNVTKTFMDMAKMEMTSEREALIMSRKIASEDCMENQINWRLPYIVDQPELKIQPGCNSLEKDIQFAREKNVLQSLYFHKRMIPDSPGEPPLENHQMSDPIIIPLDDPESQEIDLRKTPWPEPKIAPPVEAPVNMPPMFRSVPHQQLGFQNFQPMNPGFQGMPRFAGPNGPGGPPMVDGPPIMENPFLPTQAPFAHPSMMNPNMMPHQNIAPPPEMMGQGPMDPNIFIPGGGPMGPPEGFNPMMGDNYGMPFNQANMGMYHPQNQGNTNNNNSNNNYNMDRGHDRGNDRGGPRGGRGFRRGANNSGGWVRLNNGPNHGGSWNRSGGGPRTNRVCKNVKNHGYCRNIDNCPFIHPN